METTEYDYRFPRLQKVVWVGLLSTVLVLSVLAWNTNYLLLTAICAGVGLGGLPLAAFLSCVPKKNIRIELEGAYLIGLSTTLFILLPNSQELGMKLTLLTISLTLIGYIATYLLYSRAKQGTAPTASILFI